MSLTDFNTDDILKGWTLRGKQLPPETIASLKEEATQLYSSTLWRILKAEVEWFAIKSLLEDGKDESDIRAARLLGNMIQVIDKKLLAIIEKE